MNHFKITYIEPLKNNKINRKSVPKALKDRLWDTTFGPEAGQGDCYVCGATINSKRFEAGHIVAVHNGGGTNLENLKCICSTCNKSMGTQNLEHFKKIYFPSILNNVILKKQKCVCKCQNSLELENDVSENSSDEDFNTSLIINNNISPLPSNNFFKESLKMDGPTESRDVPMESRDGSTESSDEVDYLRQELNEKLKFFDKFIYKEKK